MEKSGGRRGERTNDHDHDDVYDHVYVYDNVNEGSPPEAPRSPERGAP